MPRPRKPTRVLELTGAFKKDPARGRAREGEPHPEGALGNPPNCLDEVQKARWNELKKQAPWLTVSDRILVEQTCRLWALERAGTANATQSRLLSTNLGKLGMTPSDRSKVKVPGERPGKKNPFSALRAQRKALGLA